MDNDAVSTTSASMVNIENIVNDLSQGKDIHNLVDCNSVDNMKAFLLIYARSQVNRVMKLTSSLELMEDRLLDEYLTNSQKYDANTIMRIINTIQNSLTSAINLIKLVTGDDTFMQIIYNDNKTINTEINSVSSTIDISSPESRDKLRTVTSILLKKIKESENAKF